METVFLGLLITGLPHRIHCYYGISYFCLPALTSVRVGSDLRTLYAIGEIDDYELLKKEIAETNIIIGGLEVLLREKLAAVKAATTAAQVCRGFSNMPDCQRYGTCELDAYTLRGLR